GFQATWVWEEMSLNNYVGQIIKIRFKIVSDQGLTYDGFYFDDLSVNIISSTTQIEEVSSKEYLISQNIPNPANTITHVNIALNNKSNLMLNIYNAIGELVREEKISDKQTSISIDVRSLSNGTYFYRVGNENFHSKMMKMVVLK
ncbi:MAG: T9SS type A sorting domain-containing protein, partial [Bacteroidota bacterium]|nr:T9SS type A sorting domain-containing protein [Bacteroidota bacterium]